MSVTSGSACCGVVAPADGDRPAVGVRRAGPGLVGVLLVWLACGALLLAVLITYARLPPEQLYRVDRGGLAGGASRAVVLLNFPVAIVAIPLLAIVMSRLLASRWAERTHRRRTVVVVASLALFLCSLTAVPGVVRADSLDARPINALPAFGVGMVLLLTLLTVRTCGVGRLGPSGLWDGARFVVAGLLALVSLPWFFADIGLYIDDLPPFGAVFVARGVIPPGAALPAVHLGHHHGADGLLFAVSALALTRTLPFIAGARLRVVLVFALALMFVYGVAILTEDAWSEQVVKRGWATVRVPSVLRPDATPTWAVVVFTSLVLHLIIQRGLRRRIRQDKR